ncbi:MAG: hydantoinase/oxoprolinase family protein [Mycobacteriales bacterium]
MTRETTPPRIRIGIDAGGTFTDVVALDEDTGDLVVTKVPSTPKDPADGFLTAVAAVLTLMKATGNEISTVCHGTTVATNQLLTDDIGTLGFITTEGYEFVLEIARQSVPDGYGNSYFWVKPPRIVPAHQVRTVGGRLDATGAQLRPFDTDAAVAVARDLRAEGINTVGVCFLHSYASDAHERAMRDVLEREHPDAVVSISSEVLREYREYERSVTTLVDAAVKPKMASYVANIGRRLAKLAPRSSFFVMKSNGGVLSAQEVAKQPITTVLSGPAAGALGAALIAGQAGYPRVLTLDGGGTSTDVAVVLDGEPTLTTEGSIGRYPSKIPMVDVVTVGAGGGSVAWVSPEGTLKVGPRSAGAEPGPICYLAGGTEPTVTDAHLVLGRIPPHLLGGKIPLDADAARKGMQILADQLGLSLEECARGVLEVSAWNQANAIRQVTVKRGLDVRDFVVATFGGSGSLLLCRLIDILGIHAVLVPRDPGNVSAFGLLTVDVKNDYVQTSVVAHADLAPDGVTAGFTALEDQAREALEREGFAIAEHRYLRSADLRYSGQGSEVRVSVPEGVLNTADTEVVVAAFHDEHERLYGYCYRGNPVHGVEWVNLRVSGIGPITRPEPRLLAAREGSAERARTGTRQACFEGWVDTAIYWRPDLAPGDWVTGPAIIEEFGATIPVHPGFSAAVDGHGNLLVSS